MDYQDSYKGPGQLMQNKAGGRFYLNQRVNEFTSGESVEVKIGEDWHPGRFEYSHDYNGYYIILRNGFYFLPMDGTTVRRPQ